MLTDHEIYELYRIVLIRINHCAPSFRTEQRQHLTKSDDPHLNYELYHGDAGFDRIDVKMDGSYVVINLRVTLLDGRSILLNTVDHRRGYQILAELMNSGGVVHFNGIEAEPSYLHAVITKGIAERFINHRLRKLQIIAETGCHLNLEEHTEVDYVYLKLSIVLEKR